MAYAGVGELRGRAGRLASAWDDDSTPSVNDLGAYVDQIQGEVDAALAAHGIAVPLTSATALLAAKKLVLDGALVLALEATFPNGGPPGADAMLTGARSRYLDADGTVRVEPLVALVTSESGGEEGGGGGSGAASDTWSLYGLDGNESIPYEALEIRRSMRF